MADTDLTQLVINVGTTAQIEAGISGGTITENMLSVSTDGDTYIQGVKVNGTELTPDANNKVDVLTSDILPSQTSQSGKFLTTNGTTASWDNIPTELPTQAGNNGKYLTTNGTSASWANIPTEIPSQTGQSGKYLTTNGTTASWGTVDALPSQTGNSGKYLTTNGTSASWGEIAEYTAQEVETLWGSL